MTDEYKVKCGTCQHVFDAVGTDIGQIPDLWERVLPGDTFPAAECPVCKSLAYPMDDEAESKKPLAPELHAVSIRRRLLDLKAEHVTRHVLIALMDCGMPGMSSYEVEHMESAVRVALGEIEG